MSIRKLKLLIHSQCIFHGWSYSTCLPIFIPQDHHFPPLSLGLSLVPSSGVKLTWLALTTAVSASLELGLSDLGSGDLASVCATNTLLTAISRPPESYFTKVFNSGR